MIPDEAVTKLEEWFARHFKEGRIDSEEIFDRDVQLFRVTAPDGTTYELEITEEAFEDRRVDEILEDLKEEEVAERLRSDPSMRLCYYRGGKVPATETRWITCDGRSYRIVRDADHNVVVYDSQDQPLGNLPDDILVLPSSIHRRRKEKWRSDIRKWRRQN